MAEEQQQPEQILMQSVVTPDMVPLVQLRWGDLKCQLSPQEARQHALGILECAEAAMHDTALVGFLTHDAGIDITAAVVTIGRLRKYRGDVDREDWREPPSEQS